ncbi:hypothetical protein AB5J62_05585 [Amycolatopsis sp. cg5]|uniref:hypothetical protein n=1 Tax=Amycolatopsis sp. cg5 TaxID=3238802 RepID=UPI003523E234
MHDADVPMLTQEGWILPQPVPVENVQLEWADKPLPDDQSSEAHSRASRLLPWRTGTERYPSYSGALVQLTNRSQLYDGNLYRPTAIESMAGSLRLKFTEGSYFEHLDTTEVLAYEAASRSLAGHNSVDGRYRRWLRDPFDLTRRATGLGTVTLTIRLDNSHAGFYMHKRDAKNLSVGPGVVHAIPAGEFAPADIGLDSMSADFDVWHTVMREYAEEFLDIEEAYGRGGRPLDYDNDWPYSELSRARESGDLRPYVLGIGLDVLTWKPELLLVCVIDSTVFDSIFAEMVTAGREGTIIVGPRGHGIAFDKANISSYIDSANTRGAAKACLALTWRHRVELGLA